MNRRPTFLASCAILLALVTGCASTPGRQFTSEAATPADKALVYVYRDSGVIGGGVSYMVRANGQDVSRLPAGGYFPYLASPGDIEFTAQTEASTSVKIDAKAGETYYVKGTIGIGFFVGHPRLVVVAPDVGAAEIAACALVPGASSTAPQTTTPSRTSGGPMATAVIHVTLADVIGTQDAKVDVPVSVVDRRTRVVLERTTIGHTAMSAVVLHPSETELIRGLVRAKFAEARPTGSGAPDEPPLTCDIDEFSVTTPATILYWDVTTDIRVTLRRADQQRSLRAHASKRTFVWPTEALIKDATTDALKSLATQMTTALRALSP